MRTKIKENENITQFDNAHCVDCDDLVPISFDVDVYEETGELEYYCKKCLGDHESN